MQRLKRTWLNLPLRVKGSLMIALPVLLLAVLLVPVAIVDGQRERSEEALLRAEQVRSHARRLLAAVLEAEGAVAKFTLTRDEELLRPYEQASVARQEEVRSLRDLMEPEQAPRVQRLELLSQERIDLLEQTLRVAHGGGAPAERRLAALVRGMRAGQQKTEALRQEVEALDQAISRSLPARAARAAKARSASNSGIWVVAGICIAGGLLANWLFRVGVVNRVGTLKESAERIVRGDASDTPFLGEDEIGRLGLQFEEMIYGLLSRELQLRDSAAALEETSALQRAILDSSEYHIISTDTQGVIRTFNRAAERVLGYRAEEMVGRATPLVFHDPSEMEARAVELTAALGTEVTPGFEVFIARARRGEPFESEWTYVGKDGRRTPVLCSITALRNAEEEITGYLGIGSDITERKRYERELVEAREVALEASKAKSEFLATMSHEIRTPMNAIIGMADLLSETPLTEDQRQYVSVFQRAGHTLLQLINDILDLSKVEAGQLELEEGELDVRDLGEQTTEFFSVRAHEKGLELACDVKPEVPERILGDAHRVRQILVNLLGNAVKFTAAGEIVLRICRDPDDPHPGALIFSVTDTGVGIPPDKRESIFEAFTQVDSSTTRRHGGTGLGLAISSKLAALMNGRITVQSEPGKGSQFEFRVRFPVVAQPSEVNERRAVDLVGLRVLVVDDNATNRLILRELLTGWGAEVEEASGGGPALEATREASGAGRPFKLVLLDGRMPDMDGFQVAGAMQKAGFWSETTVMMLTSDNRAGDILRSRQIGLSAYLVKPIKRADLLDAVQTALARKAGSSHSTSARPESEPAMVAGPPRRILLVEDSADNRTLILAYLKKTPYEVEVAVDGGEAVRRFTEGDFDLVLMDVQMPVMDGYAATEAIRLWEREHGRAQTPILALTANALREDEERSLEAGCTGHLTKPIKKALLIEALERQLQGGEHGA